jgi:hypothetical protein
MTNKDAKFGDDPESVTIERAVEEYLAFSKQCGEIEPEVTIKNIDWKFTIEGKFIEAALSDDTIMTLESFEPNDRPQ